MSLATQIETLIISAAKQLASQIVIVVKQHIADSVSFDAPKSGIQTGKKSSSKTGKKSAQATPAEKVSTLTPAQLSARRKTLAKARKALAAKRKAAKAAIGTGSVPVKVKAKGTSGHKNGKKTIAKKRQAVSVTKTPVTVVKAANGHAKPETTASA